MRCWWRGVERNLQRKGKDFSSTFSLPVHFSGSARIPSAPHIVREETATITRFLSLTKLAYVLDRGQ